jgi:hypothetical protein
MTEQDLLSELASFTEAGEHTKFQLLQNWEEYKTTRKIRYTVKVLLKYIRKLVNNQFKSYCVSVTDGTSDVYRLLAYVTLVKIQDFYTEELRITEDMLDEYETYLCSGNWRDFVFGTPRPADKLWDHRGEQLWNIH